MHPNLQSFDPWLLAPLGYVAFGWLAGVLLERLLVGRLRRLAARTDWEGDDILLDYDLAAAAGEGGDGDVLPAGVCHRALPEQL